MSERDHHQHDQREQGYALLITLVTVGLVAIVLGQMEMTARRGAQIAIGLRDQAAAKMAADGAIWNALFHSLPGQAAWGTDVTPHTMKLGDASIEVEVENLADRVDLNRDSAASAAVMLRADGVDGGAALALGQKLTDWRGQNPAKQPMGAKLPEYRAAHLPYAPPNENYENLAETELVMGISPDLARKLENHVTIYGFGQPQIAMAHDRLQLEALKTALQGQPAPPDEPPSIFFFAVTAHAHQGHAEVVRKAVFRVNMDASNQGQFWRVMEWR
jgi:general secretion pathway protein K